LQSGKEIEKLGDTLAKVGGESLVDTLSKSLQKLEVKTLLYTEMLNKVGVKTFGFTLRKKKAKALVNTLANSQKEVDVEKLSKTLIEV